MSEEKPSLLKELFPDGIRGLFIVLVSLLTFFFQQLNGTMRELTAAIRTIELRVTQIEADRSAKSEQYRNVVQDVQEMKTQMAQISVLTKTMTEFMAKYQK